MRETDANFMTGQGSHDAQNESRANAVDGENFLNKTKNPIQINDPQVDMHTVEKNIVSKVRSEVDSVIISAKTRLQDTVLTAR